MAAPQRALWRAGDTGEAARVGSPAATGTPKRPEREELLKANGSVRWRPWDAPGLAAGERKEGRSPAEGARRKRRGLRVLRKVFPATAATWRSTGAATRAKDRTAVASAATPVRKAANSHATWKQHGARGTRVPFSASYALFHSPSMPHWRNTSRGPWTHSRQCWRLQPGPAYWLQQPQHQIGGRLCQWSIRSSHHNAHRIQCGPFRAAQRGGRWNEGQRWWATYLWGNRQHCGVMSNHSINIAYDLSWPKPPSLMIFCPQPSMRILSKKTRRPFSISPQYLEMI